MPALVPIGLFAGLRCQWAETKPDAIEQAAEAWHRWRERASRQLPLPLATRVLVVVRISCVDDIILHGGLFHLLSLRTIQPLVYFALPNAATVSIARNQALREGWASLVSLRSAAEISELLLQFPDEMPIALFASPAPFSTTTTVDVKRSVATPLKSDLAWANYIPLEPGTFIGHVSDLRGLDDIFAITPLLPANVPQDDQAPLQFQDGPPTFQPRDSEVKIEDREIRIGADKIELHSPHGATLISVSVLTEGEKACVTALQPVLLARDGHELNIPILPRYASEFNQRMQIRVSSSSDVTTVRELNFNVPPANIESWMLSAYLNRGGGGNPAIRAFASGTGCRLAYAEDEPEELRDIPVVWGVLRGSDRILTQAQLQGLYFFYIDHAYFDRGHGKSYRISRNRYEAGKIRKVKDDRLRRLDLEIKPWRKRGKSIIVCPPTEYFMAAHNCADWLETTLAALRLETDRPILVREKPQPGHSSVPLAQALQKAHALVTHSSNVAIEAACLGTPVFVSPTSAAAPIGRTDVGLIESPIYPDRDKWLCHLAYSQYTIDELRDGSAWALLQYLEDCQFA